jgi:3,4-dihydroxy 2-butanone 4-phosphate synthase/GTP cyclohydrolase II
VVDDADREDEGYLFMVAEEATADRVAFFLEHTSGVICSSQPEGVPSGSNCP